MLVLAPGLALGAWLAWRAIARRPAPPTAPTLHFVLAGIGCAIALSGAPPSARGLSLGVFIAAALGGFALRLFRLGEAWPPRALVIGHALLGAAAAAIVIFAAGRAP